MSEIFAAIRMLYELFMGAKALMNFVEANKNEKWFQDSAVTIAKLKAAKTEDEYKQVAKDLRDLWGGAK